MLPTKDKKTDPMILMERAKSGDNDAYGELYEQYFTPIFRFILPKVSMRDTAEDLTQVVFIKVFESLKNFKNMGHSPLSYFFTVARNTVFDFYKKKKDLVIGENSGDDEMPNIFEKLADENPNPLESIEISEKKKSIISMIGSLEGSQKEVVYLKFIEDLSNPEIARILDKSEDAVRQIQSRALRKLKVLFTEKELI